MGPPKKTSPEGDFEKLPEKKNVYTVTMNKSGEEHSRGMKATRKTLQKECNQQVQGQGDWQCGWDSTGW